MPTYCYTTGDRQLTVERQFPMGEAPVSIRLFGRLARRDICAEHNGHRRVADPWPLRSDACGVSPEEIPDAQRNLASKGVSAEFDTKTGAMIFENRTHRRKVLKALGLFDRDGGYSDG